MRTSKQLQTQKNNQIFAKNRRFVRVCFTDDEYQAYLTKKAMIEAHLKCRLSHNEFIYREITGMNKNLNRKD